MSHLASNLLIDALPKSGFIWQRENAASLCVLQSSRRDYVTKQAIMSLPTVRHWRKSEIQPIIVAAIDAVAEAMGDGISTDKNILSVIGSVRDEIDFAANLTESIWIDLVHKIGAARKRYLRSDDNRIMANDYGQLSTMAISADRMLELAGDSWRESTFHLYFHPGLIGGSIEENSGEEDHDEGLEDNKGEYEYEDEDYESDEDHDVVMLGHAVSELDLAEETGDIEMSEYYREDEHELWGA